jgi:hypothetical protein
MMLEIFPMLMYTISLTIHKTMAMTVHNQYLDIEPASPVCFCNRGKSHECLVERMNTDTVMKINFRVDPDQDEPKGILTYKVQRKRNASPDHQSNIDVTCTNSIEGALKMMQLLVIWKIERFWKPKARIMLIEYGNELVLNQDQLVQLCDKIDVIPTSYSSSRWLMCDNTVLTTKYEVVDEKDLELKVAISEEVENEYIVKPMWIDSTR